MSDGPIANQKNKPTASDHRKLTGPTASSKPVQTGAPDPPPERVIPPPPGNFKRFRNWVGSLNFLLLGLVIAVAMIGYLSSRQVILNRTLPTQLIIVQLNDIYRLDAVRAGKRGGLARVVALLRQLKTQNPDVPVIVLHAGDFLSPSLESNLFHGAQMIDAMNFINDVAPLYAVPGNHEFDYSDADQRYLTDAVLRSNFTWIASNLERNNSALLPVLKDKEKVKPHIVVPFGKINVGIFGLTIDGAQGGKDRTYAPISGEYARIAATEIEQLENEGADLIVGLTHLNIDDDHELAKLKQQHPTFRWIAGGHEHSLNRESGSSTTALITKGDSNARTVWKISVVKDGRNVDVREESIIIDESIQPDPAFSRDIENFYRVKLREERPYMDSVIAAQPDRCYDGTEEAVRDRESNWGDLLTDTMRTAFKGTKADVAVLNGGSIRIDDVICDRITFENLERTFAYETPVVFVKLKGEYLKKYLLEDSVRSKRGDGRFLQVSGVSFRRGLSSGTNEVINDLEVQSVRSKARFDQNKTYVVAVNKYIFDCGDGYKFRQFVTDYISAGPDLRSLTYAVLSSKNKTNRKPTLQSPGRIIDMPSYTKLSSAPAPKWQKLNAAEQQCH